MVNGKCNIICPDLLQQTDLMNDRLRHVWVENLTVKITRSGKNGLMHSFTVGQSFFALTKYSRRTISGDTI